MHDDTRKHFDRYTQGLGDVYGVSDVTKSFSVQAPVEQKIEKKIQESSDFLMKINVRAVDLVEGRKRGLFGARSAASRTDTSQNARKPVNIIGSFDDGYRCEKTNFDTAITYDDLDEWAGDLNFEKIVSQIPVEQQARDRIMIGWNGISVAKETDYETYPLLEDVNKGWLHKIREKGSENYIGTANIGPDSVIDLAANLDAAVLASKRLIHTAHQGRTDFVVICGSDLVDEKYVNLVGSADAPTERAALNSLLANKTLGGLPVVIPPYFPSNAFLITPLKNLSLYWQKQSRRRKLKEQDERDQIVFFDSVREAYVVEDFTACVLVENLTFDSGA